MQTLLGKISVRFVTAAVTLGLTGVAAGQTTGSAAGQMAASAAGQTTDSVAGQMAASAAGSGATSQQEVKAPTDDGTAVARSFAELTGKIEPGDTVYVTREAGERTRAEVQGFDAELSTLFLNADGASFGLTETELSQLELRYGDSLVNGAVIGAIAGSGIFVVAGIACALVSDCHAASETFAAAALMGGIGAGIGVGIDAAVKTERLVFVGPASPATGMQIVPVISATRRGAMVVLRF